MADKKQSKLLADKKQSQLLTEKNPCVDNYIQSHNNLLKKKQTKYLKNLDFEEIKKLQGDLQNKYISLDLTPIIQEISNECKKTGFPNDEQIDKYDSGLNFAFKLLNRGYNVCFYGLGNKEDIVDQFFESKFSESHIIIKVKGYDSNLQPKNLFLSILQIFNFNITEPIGKEIENIKKKRNVDMLFVVTVIISLLGQLDFPILFLFHNLDGINFLNKQILGLLGKLARESKIYFVATIDSISFPQVIGKNINQDFSFIYIPLNTYMMYDKQLIYLRTVDFNKKGNNMASSFHGILESFTDNQRFVY